MMRVLLRALRPTPLKFIAFFFTYPVLWWYHGWCRPFLAIPQGRITHCGAFSQWLLEHPAAHSVYASLGGWWLVLINLIGILMLSLAFEWWSARRADRGAGGKRQPTSGRSALSLRWVWAVLLVIVWYVFLVKGFLVGG